MSLWTRERELMLRNLHALGLAPQAIASKMGGGFSRAVVVNKLWDLGLKCQTPPIPAPPREKFRPERSEERPISLPMLPVSRVLSIAE